MDNKNNKNNKVHEWHHQQELILKRWSEIGSSYRFLHDKAFIYYNKRNMEFTIPVIVISTITGTANFAQGSFPESWKTYVPLVIGFFNLAAGLITTIGQFLRVSELLEGHRSASVAYSKFSRNISVELSLPLKERTSSGTNFINSCRTELDKLIEQSPNIPEYAIKSFIQQFPDKDIDGNPINQFFKPEIFEIKAVEIYKDTDEQEQLINEKLAIKQKQENELRNKIREEEQNIRNNIYLKMKQEKEEKDKEIEKAIQLSDIVKKEFIKKEKMTTSYVNKAMDSLLSSIKPKVDKFDDVFNSNPISDMFNSDNNVNDNIIIDISDNNINNNNIIDISNNSNITNINGSSI